MNKKTIKTILKSATAAGVVIGGVNTYAGAELVFAEEFKNEEASLVGADEMGGSQSEAEPQALAQSEAPAETPAESQQTVESQSAANSESLESMSAQAEGNSLSEETAASESLSMVESTSVVNSTFASESLVVEESTSTVNADADSTSAANASASVSALESEADSIKASDKQSMSIVNSQFNSQTKVNSESISNRISASESTSDLRSESFSTAKSNSASTSESLSDAFNSLAVETSLSAQSQAVASSLTEINSQYDADYDQLLKEINAQIEVVGGEYTKATTTGNNQLQKNGKNNNYWGEADKLAKLLIKQYIYNIEGGNVDLSQLGSLKTTENNNFASTDQNYIKVTYGGKVKYFDYVNIDINGERIKTVDGVVGIAISEKTPTDQYASKTIRYVKNNDGEYVLIDNNGKEIQDVINRPDGSKDKVNIEYYVDVNKTAKKKTGDIYRLFDGDMGGKGTIVYRQTEFIDSYADLRVDRSELTSLNNSLSSFNGSAYASASEAYSEAVRSASLSYYLEASTSESNSSVDRDSHKEATSTQTSRFNSKIESRSIAWDASTSTSEVASSLLSQAARLSAEAASNSASIAAVRSESFASAASTSELNSTSASTSYSEAKSTSIANSNSAVDSASIARSDYESVSTSAADSASVAKAYSESNSDSTKNSASIETSNSVSTSESISMSTSTAAANSTAASEDTVTTTSVATPAETAPVAAVVTPIMPAPVVVGDATDDAAVLGARTREDGIEGSAEEVGTGEDILGGDGMHEEEIPLGVRGDDVEEVESEKLVIIEDENVAKANIGVEKKRNWWWLLLLIAAFITGKTAYDKKNEKGIFATEDTEANNEKK